MLHPADSNPPDTDPNARATNEKRGVSSALFESLQRTNFAPAPSELAQFPREEPNFRKTCGVELMSVRELSVTSREPTLRRGPSRIGW